MIFRAQNHSSKRLWVLIFAPCRHTSIIQFLIIPLRIDIEKRGKETRRSVLVNFSLLFCGNRSNRKINQTRRRRRISSRPILRYGTFRDLNCEVKWTNRNYDAVQRWIQIQFYDPSSIRSYYFALKRVLTIENDRIGSRWRAGRYHAGASRQRKLICIFLFS